MLYLDCQHDPVRLTEHFRGTRESEQRKILLMTVLSPRIGSLNLFHNLQPSLLRSLPQRGSMCNCLK